MIPCRAWFVARATTTVGIGPESALVPANRGAPSGHHHVLACMRARQHVPSAVTAVRPGFELAATSSGRRRRAAAAAPGDGRGPSRAGAGFQKRLEIVEISLASTF